MRVIDVSENNGAIDWEAVKKAGIEGVIVRSSYGKHEEDEMFRENVAGAQAVGLKVGAYHYSYALSEADALMEAWNCRDVIESSGVLLELGVWFDMEDADHYKERNGFEFDPALITRMCDTFLNNIGYDGGIYASLSWFDEYIDWKALGCAVWNAEWQNDSEEPDEDNDSIKGYAWQWTDCFEIDGKLFDADIFRVN